MARFKETIIPCRGQTCLYCLPCVIKLCHVPPLDIKYLATRQVKLGRGQVSTCYVSCTCTKLIQLYNHADTESSECKFPTSVNPKLCSPQKECLYTVSSIETTYIYNNQNKQSQNIFFSESMLCRLYIIYIYPPITSNPAWGHLNRTLILIDFS